MNATLEFLKVNAKAVAGFVAGLVLNAITAVVQGQVPWPQNLTQWAQYLGTALLSGVLVWATQNKLTPTQVVKGAVTQDITVVSTQAINTAASAARQAVKDAMPSAAPIAETAIRDVAQQVSTTVAEVLKGVADNFPNQSLPVR